MTLFPYGALLAAVTSLVLLGTLWSLGELTSRAVLLLACCFLLAGYYQFFAASSVANLSGLVAQTTLALYLVFRWRLAG